MEIASHADKVERLSRLRERFDPAEDFELWYWTTLTAGTNMYNACLHLCGLTRDDPVFSTIPGMHWVKQPDGTYGRELRGPGDISHVGWPPVEGVKPPHILSMEHALERIETYRDPCVRGSKDITQAVIGDCQSAFAEAYEIFSAALAQDAGQIRGTA